MIDVARNDGASARDLAAHEFGRDEQRHGGAEAFTVVMRGLRAVEHGLAAEILALGDVDHLLGDDAGARPFELGDLPPYLFPACGGGWGGGGAQRPVRVGEVAGEVLAGHVAVVHRLDGAAFVFLDPAALAHPFDAGAGKPLLDVDRDFGIRIGAGGIVDRHRRRARLGERDLAQRHAQLGGRIGPRIDLARAGQRSGRDLRRGDVGIMNVHRLLSFWSGLWRLSARIRNSSAPGRERS